MTVLQFVVVIAVVVSTSAMLVWALRQSGEQERTQFDAINAKHRRRIAALSAYRIALDRHQRGVGSADDVAAAYHAVLRVYSERDRQTDEQEPEGVTE